MHEHVKHARHRQHNHDARLLRSRTIRPGEPALTGDRWWPHETWKYADLSDEGVHLTSYERWLAEREIQRRARRAAMPSVVQRDSLHFEPTRAPGVYVAYIVAPHRDQEAPSHTVELLHLRPGARTIQVSENESVAHVLSGQGSSLIYDETHSWGPHDSVHVPEGAWHQHVNDGPEPVNLIIGRVTPLIEQLYTMARVYLGDTFSDLPDDFKPEHPFTKERVSVGYVDGMKWMSNMQLSHRRDAKEIDKLNRTARKVLRASEAIIERSHHKGDWKVELVDSFLGFSNRFLSMAVHQLPPNCHTETHKHGWATIYVLSGQGYSIVDGDRYDWRVGDMLHVPAGAWHQHFNTDTEQVSQHLLITNQALRYAIHSTYGSVEERDEVLPDFPDDDYSPMADWWAQAGHLA